MIRLLPMTAAQFDAYLGPAIADYAEAHRKAGDADAEEALVLAKADYDSLLPLGIETPSHHLFTIVDGATSEAVGTRDCFMANALPHVEALVIKSSS